MTLPRRAALGLLGAAALAGGAGAQNGAPVTLPGLRQFDIAPRAGGRPPWRIFLRQPDGPAPAAGWPALFLLDANAVIGIASDALRVQAAFPGDTGIRDGVLVGIGYPTEAAYDDRRRPFDLTPPPEKGRTGGAEGFLRFIVEELQPFIASQVPLDRSRQGIFGHSLGGLCVVWSLLTRPRAFTHWVAMSPSLQFDAELIGQAQQRFTALPPAERGQPRLLLGAGEFEERLAPFQAAAGDAAMRRESLGRTRIPARARELADRLRGLGIDARFEPTLGETHFSSIPVAVNRAIRFVLGPDQ
jgi:predicted alpha/beta superfamily hydrolase